MTKLTVDKALDEWAINYQPTTVMNKQSASAGVGAALKEIRDKRLYRGKYEDFYVYCARRFGLKPNVVDGYIATAEGGELKRQDKKESIDALRYIYFIAGAGLIKIGVADDVGKRFAAIKTMSPIPLSLIGYIEGDESKERNLHRKFSMYRQHGEWFTDCPAIRKYIAGVAT